MIIKLYYVSNDQVELLRTVARRPLPVESLLCGKLSCLKPDLAQQQWRLGKAVLVQQREEQPLDDLIILWQLNLGSL